MILFGGKRMKKGAPYSILKPRKKAATLKDECPWLTTNNELLTFCAFFKQPFSPQLWKKILCGKKLSRRWKILFDFDTYLNEQITTPDILSSWWGCFGFKKVDACKCFWWSLKNKYKYKRYCDHLIYHLKYSFVIYLL